MRQNTGKQLEIDALACRRGEHELFADFRLSIAPGEAIQIAGSNGSGKTTLLRTISGVQRPAAGRVLWDRADIHADDEAYARERLYLGHENALNPDLTPFESLVMLQKLHGGAGDARRALQDWGLREALDRVCRRLSAGQRRRAALARLSLSDAHLWLLDEPAAALDAAGRERLSAAIARHLQSRGQLIFTTHEPLDLPGVKLRTIEL